MALQIRFARKAFRAFVDVNRTLARLQTRVVNRWTRRTDGRVDFCQRLLPALVRPGIRVLDVGSGKQPLLDPATRHRLRLHVVGLDVSASELARAPAGSYDEVVVGDVTCARLPQEFDLILSRAVLEHVDDTAAAIDNLAAALVPGGQMAHFVPCRNAPFAQINRLLGNRRARQVLYTIYPDKRATQGFPAYYDHCTPRQLSRLCVRSGLEVDRVIPYYHSEYFAFFAPAHALELLRQLCFLAVGWGEYAETFSLIAGKPTAESGGLPLRRAG